MIKTPIIGTKALDPRPYLLWPTLGFFALMLLFVLLHLDQWFADRIFNWEGGAWTLRDAWLTSTVIHDGGRKLVVFILLLLVALIGFSFQLTWLKLYRSGLVFVLSCALISGLLVNLLKAESGIYCPWDLVQYGGDRVYQSWFALLFSGQKGGACFPAGHASAAYAWFGFYFFTLQYFPQWRRTVFLAVIFLGLVFGIGQQLRGAHFLSHDLSTAWICWITASGLYLVYSKAGQADIRDLSDSELH